VSTDKDRPKYASIAGWCVRRDAGDEWSYWDGKAWNPEGPPNAPSAPLPSQAGGRQRLSGTSIALIVVLVIAGLILVSCVAVVGTIGGLMNQGM
jgi:hypothetical protein